MTAPALAPAPGALPWAATDLLRVYTANGLGIVLLGVGWFGASGSVHGTQQVQWAALAVLGTVIAGAANGTWITVGRRAIATRRSAVQTGLAAVVQSIVDLHADHPVVRPGVVSGVVSGVAAPASSAVGLAGSRLWHLADCQLVLGKTALVPLAARQQADRSPCGMCAS